MNARVAFHRNHGRAIAMIKKELLNGLGRVETKLDSGSAGIVTRLEGAVDLFENSLEKINISLNNISTNTDIYQGISEDKIRSIFLCMRAINRLEDILLDHDYPSTPSGKPKATGLTNNLNRIKDDVLIKGCLECLTENLGRRLKTHHELTGDENLKIRLEKYHEIQTLRKDIISTISKEGCKTKNQTVSEAKNP